MPGGEEALSTSVSASTAVPGELSVAADLLSMRSGTPSPSAASSSSSLASSPVPPAANGPSVDDAEGSKPAKKTKRKRSEGGSKGNDKKKKKKKKNALSAKKRQRQQTPGSPSSPGQQSSVEAAVTKAPRAAPQASSPSIPSMDSEEREGETARSPSPSASAAATPSAPSSPLVGGAERGPTTAASGGKRKDNGDNGDDGGWEAFQVAAAAAAASTGSSVSASAATEGVFKSATAHFEHRPRAAAQAAAAAGAGRRSSDSSLSVSSAAAVGAGGGGRNSAIFNNIAEAAAAVSGGAGGAGDGGAAAAVAGGEFTGAAATAAVSAAPAGVYCDPGGTCTAKNTAIFGNVALAALATMKGANLRKRPAGQMAEAARMSSPPTDPASSSSSPPPEGEDGTSEPKLRTKETTETASALTLALLSAAEHGMIKAGHCADGDKKSSKTATANRGEEHCCGSLEATNVKNKKRKSDPMLGAVAGTELSSVTPPPFGSSPTTAAKKTKSLTSFPQGEEDVVLRPTVNDVVACDQIDPGGAFHRVGNRRFRVAVEWNLGSYFSDAGRSRTVSELLKSLATCVPPARFLKRLRPAADSEVDAAAHPFAVMRPDETVQYVHRTFQGAGTALGFLRSQVGAVAAKELAAKAPPQAAGAKTPDTPSSGCATTQPILAAAKSSTEDDVAVAAALLSQQRGTQLPLQVPQLPSSPSKASQLPLQVPQPPSSPSKASQLQLPLSLPPSSPSKAPAALPGRRTVRFNLEGRSELQTVLSPQGGASGGGGTAAAARPFTMLDTLLHAQSVLNQQIQNQQIQNQQVKRQQIQNQQVQRQAQIEAIGGHLESVAQQQVQRQAKIEVIEGHLEALRRATINASAAAKIAAAEAATLATMSPQQTSAKIAAALATMSPQRPQQSSVAVAATAPPAMAVPAPALAAPASALAATVNSIVTPQKPPPSAPAPALAPALAAASESIVPSKADVLVVSGTVPPNHIGNRRFRALVECHLRSYLRAAAAQPSPDDNDNDGGARGSEASASPEEKAALRRGKLSRLRVIDNVVHAVRRCCRPEGGGEGGRGGGRFLEMSDDDDGHWVVMDSAQIIRACDRSFRECRVCYRERPGWWMEATLDEQFADDVREELRLVAASGGAEGRGTPSDRIDRGDAVVPPVARGATSPSRPPDATLARNESGADDGAEEPQMRSDSSAVSPRESSVNPAAAQVFAAGAAPASVRVSSASTSDEEAHPVSGEKEEKATTPTIRDSPDSSKPSGPGGASVSSLVPPSFPPGIEQLQDEAKRRLLRGRMCVKEHEIKTANVEGPHVVNHSNNGNDTVSRACALAAFAEAVTGRRVTAGRETKTATTTMMETAEEATAGDAKDRAIPEERQVDVNDLRSRAGLLTQTRMPKSPAEERQTTQAKPPRHGSDALASLTTKLAVPGMADSAAIEAQMAVEQMTLEELKARAAELLRQRELLRMHQQQQRQMFEEAMRREVQQRAAALGLQNSSRRVSEIAPQGNAPAGLNPSMLKMVLAAQQVAALSQQAEGTNVQSEGLPSPNGNGRGEEKPQPDDVQSHDGSQESGGAAAAETQHFANTRNGPRRVSLHAEDGLHHAASVTAASDEATKQNSAAQGMLLFSSMEESQSQPPRCLAKRADRRGSLTKKADPVHVMRAGVRGQFDDCEEDEDPCSGLVQPPKPPTASKQGFAGNDLLDVIGGMMMMKNQS